MKSIQWGTGDGPLLVLDASLGRLMMDCYFSLVGTCSRTPTMTFGRSIFLLEIGRGEEGQTQVFNRRIKLVALGGLEVFITQHFVDICPAYLFLVVMVSINF